jgi:hypothetical protein
MSTGPRIKLADANRLCSDLFNIWGLDDRCVVVGSVRRGLPDVGDIEIIVPVQEVKQRGDDQFDYLFNRINASMSNPWTDPKARERSMFDPEPMSGSVVEPDPGQIVGRAVRGLKPGFLAANLELMPTGLVVPCQLYRYTESNRGWIELMRTGPAEFGQRFLVNWKRRYGIPFGEDHPASIEGHLVNREGQRVHTPTEAACFDLCGMKYIEPAERDQWVLTQQRLAAHERRGALR